MSTDASADAGVGAVPERSAEAAASVASGYRSVFRPDLFAGRTLLVTGGGSGIGRCIAHELVALGAAVALVGRRTETLAAVQAELVAAGGRAFVHACDVRDEAGVEAMVEAVLAWGGAIDGLVNNAGGQFPARLADLSLNGWNAVVANNLTSTFLVSRAVHRRWMQAHGGAIVSISADAELGNAGMGHAGAARAGQQNFTATAAVEWAQDGVRVNHVIPGFIASSGLDRYPEAAHEQLRRVRHAIPSKRHGSESEIAAAVVFLLSPAAAYVTGTGLRVDGGLHVNPRFGFYDVPDHDRSKPFVGLPSHRVPRVLDGVYDPRAEE